MLCYKNIARTTHTISTTAKTWYDQHRPTLSSGFVLSLHWNQASGNHISWCICLIDLCKASGSRIALATIGSLVWGTNSRGSKIKIFGLTIILKIISFGALALGDNIADSWQFWHQQPVLQIVTRVHSPWCNTGSSAEMLRQSHWKTQIERLTKRQFVLFSVHRARVCVCVSCPSSG